MNAATPADRPPLWRRVVGTFWFQLLLAVTVTGLVLSFVAKPFWVPSGSMEETLVPGDRVLVNRLAYVGSAPATGDIVVFDAGEEWGITSLPSANPVYSFLRWVGEVSGFGPTGPHTLIKRVIAGSGQTVECCSDDGRVVVDGEPIDEPYVEHDFPFDPGVLDCTTEPRSSRCFDRVAVPGGAFVVLGDNRTNSSDSAARCRVEDADESCWRFGYADEVVGKAVVILWPIGRWGVL